MHARMQDCVKNREWGILIQGLSTVDFVKDIQEGYAAYWCEVWVLRFCGTHIWMKEEIINRQLVFHSNRN